MTDFNVRIANEEAFRKAIAEKFAPALHAAIVQTINEVMVQFIFEIPLEELAVAELVNGDADHKEAA